MTIDEELKKIYQETAAALKGSKRRMFMARVVKMLDPGGQRLAERELGWNRGTIRKGMLELQSGVPIKDNFSARGRKPAEHHLPNLIPDIRHIVQQSREPLSPAKIRQQLEAHANYDDATLPTVETIRKKLLLIRESG